MLHQTTNARESCVHLDESPSVAFIFAQITATTPKAIKALGTTISNGVTLLERGYAFVRVNPARYVVANDKGSTHTLLFDADSRIANCDCEAYVRLGTCKHCVAVYLNKTTIDAQNDEREAKERAAITPAITSFKVATKPRSSYWDGWDEVLDFLSGGERKAA